MTEKYLDCLMVPVTKRDVPRSPYARVRTQKRAPNRYWGPQTLSTVATRVNRSPENTIAPRFTANAASRL